MEEGRKGGGKILAVAMGDRFTVIRADRFPVGRTCAIFPEGKALQMRDGVHVEQTVEARPPSLRVADWFWRPWYAKLYWVTALMYWIGLEIMITIPYDRINPSVATTMVLLIFIFNPITVVAVLGYGFLKAKVVCGEWVITRGQPSQTPTMDPYTDPFDARSGFCHLRHLGVIKD